MPARRTIPIPYRVTVKVQRRIRYEQRVSFQPTRTEVRMPSMPRASQARLSHSVTTRIREIRQNALEYAEQAGIPDEVERDLFVLHASEDQADFVRPLVAALESGGLSVWYSESALRPGMSTRQSTDSG